MKLETFNNKGEIMKISNRLLELIVDLHDGEDFLVRVNYSGRGMFGEECLGIVGSDTTTVIYKIMDAIMDEYCDEKDTQLALFHELAEMLSDGSEQDSMGQQCIVYFPYVEIDEEKKEEILNKLMF